MFRRSFLLTMIMTFVAGAAGADDANRAVGEFDSRSFLKNYCVRCHSGEEPKADRDLAALDGDLSSDDALQSWQDVVDQLNLGSMPPPKAKQPTDDERQRMVETMTGRLREAIETRDAADGQTVFRRLNRYQYDRTIRDLLALEDMLADPTDAFPPDAVEEGFDNLGKTLVTSDFLLDGYLAAAETFINAAVATGERPEVKTYRFQAPFCPTGNRHDGQDVPGQYQHIRKNTTDEGGFLWLERFAQGVPHAGYYTLRVKAAGIYRDYPYDEGGVGVRKDEPLRMAVVAGSPEYGYLGDRTTSDRKLAEFALPDDEPQWIETTLWLDEGYQPRLTFPNGPNRTKPLRKPLVSRYPEQFPKFIRGYLVPEGPINDETLNESLTRRVSREGASTDPNALTTAGTSRSFNTREGWSTFFSEYNGPRVRVFEVEIEGPHFEAWPPPSHTALFGEYEPTMANADAILERFATRAYRRPVEEDELAVVAELVRQRHLRGDAPLEAIKAGLRATLCSPGFLYLRENDGPLDDYALASRLSYFLWSSMPDDELLVLAERGKLNDRKVVADQARRMLADPRANSLTERFASRWLELYKIGSMPPSPTDFRQYYVDGLEDAIKTETKLYFQHVLDRNLPIDTFLDSDFTFVNGALARLYGIDGIQGTEFQQVALGDRRRGGLLGQASILTASANGIDTSPVVRGIWVLENLLGTPPTPPPPDVEPLEPDIRGATTIRDQLDKHRTVATCNACHRKIDPLGFALENFDPIGGWRDRYPRGRDEGPVIDASGKLPTGQAFDDIVGLKEILRTSARPQFARCLTEKMLIYATGRTLEPTDRPAVDDLVARLDERGNGLRDLVLLIVESETFRTK